MRQLWKKLTFWVDRKPSKVNFSTRLIAYALDWAIGGIIAGLPAVAIYGLVTDRSDAVSIACCLGIEPAHCMVGAIVAGCPVSLFVRL